MNEAVGQPEQEGVSEMGDCRCRYLCERCGGTGKQPEGVWDVESNSYTGKAGVCQSCNGEGYLGYISPPPDVVEAARRVADAPEFVSRSDARLLADWVLASSR